MCGSGTGGIEPQLKGKFMENYANLGGDSGVLAYQISSDFIIVQFKSGQDTFYKYTYVSAGNSAIETMKNLARQGQGLNSYISTNKPQYVSKGSSLSGL
jgi:hypothetical protein